METSEELPPVSGTTTTGPGLAGAWTASLAHDLHRWSAPAAVLRSLRRSRMLLDLPETRRLLASRSLAAHAAAEGGGDALFFLSSRSYLARGLGARARIAAAACHYLDQDRRFDDTWFNKVHGDGEGLVLWRHPVAPHDHDIVLRKGRDVADEGALSLIFRVDGGIHCVLSFSRVPGRILQVPGGSDLPHCVWFITRKHLTMERGYQADFHRAFHRVGPARMALAAFSGMVRRLGATCAVAIGAAHQPSNHTERNDRFVIAYDDFWRTCGAVPMGDDYLLPLPLPHRPLDSLPAPKRKRSRMRQEVQYEVEQSAFETVGQYLVRA